MKLYNTLTKTVDEITPQTNETIAIYTCGPTVYDYPHIGNWFTFVRYDLLVRALKVGGLKPKWVMNITDVGHLVSDADEGEDKLEKGARREGKSAWDVAAFYTEHFLKGLKDLNFLSPDYLPKATDHIPEQIAMIQELESKGFTYSISDGVYYDTAKFTDYGKFAQLDLDEQQAGARVEFNPEKRQPQDFALWKFSPAGPKRDMEWDSPWGKGFPGWHIECSAMSRKYLGDTLDVHNGGIDHIPVHHTNEIAQSEAVTGKPFARFWMHTNHITINGEKIAKSTGNGITLMDLAAKGMPFMALRLHILESHYRSQSKFSWDSLIAAKQRLADFQALADLRFQPIDKPSDSQSVLESADAAITAAMQDDLNSPAAMAAISELSNTMQEKLLSQADAELFSKLLQKIDDLFGLKLLAASDIGDELKELLDKRHEARLIKDWALSDKLRATLENANLTVRDTPHGQIWSRS